MGYNTRSKSRSTSPGPTRSPGDATPSPTHQSDSGSSSGKRKAEHALTSEQETPTKASKLSDESDGGGWETVPSKDRGKKQNAESTEPDVPKWIKVTDWRKRSKPLPATGQISRPVDKSQTKTALGKEASGPAAGTTSPFLDYKSWRVYDKSELKPGMIIVAFHVEENRGAAANDHNVRHFIETQAYGKARPMVIMVKHHFHFMALPVYTRNDRADADLPNPGEWVGIRDPRNPEHVFKSNHNPVYIDRLTTEELMRHTAMIQLMKPICKDYGDKILHIGELETASMNRLIEYFKKWATPKYSS